MATFIAAPHIRHPAARLPALRARPTVALTIDTETSPPQVLSMRGQVTIVEIDGVVPEYAEAARRYSGPEAAATYLAQIDQPGTRMARIGLRPDWVAVFDFDERVPGFMVGLSQ